MNKSLRSTVFAATLCTWAAAASAAPATEANAYLQSCLPLNTVKTLTGLPLTAASRNDAPQISCSYNDSEQLSRQSRVSYGRDPSYRMAFGASDIMHKVEGLGCFAEFDSDAGQLYVNVGSDGLMFEGRKGKTKLTLEQLKAIAQAVLQAP